MTSLSGLIRGILLTILTAMMLLLVALALVSLSRLDGDGGDDIVAAAPGAAVGPVDPVPLGPTGTEGSVSCYRPEGEGASFVVELVSPATVVGPYVIGVDLVGSDGARSTRAVHFSTVEPEVPTRSPVEDSTDPVAHTGCVITAVEIDRRIILTGR